MHYRPEVCRDCHTATAGQAACSGCDMRQPDILPENMLIKWLIDYFGVYLLDGMGGLNAAGAELALATAGCPGDRQGAALYKLGYYLTVYLQKKQEANVKQ